MHDLGLVLIGVGICLMFWTVEEVWGRYNEMPDDKKVVAAFVFVGLGVALL